MKPATILRNAAELLSQPGAWTQGAWARDANGNRLLPYEPAACCWCMRGALWVSAGPHVRDKTLAEQALAMVLRPFAKHGIAKWNDASGRTVDEVRAALLEAAERLEAQP